MTISAEDALRFQASFDRIANHIGQAFVGARQPIEFALICLLSGGHLLLEDVPGKGKTLLARSLARDWTGMTSHMVFPAMPATDLLAWLVDELGAGSGGDRTFAGSLRRLSGAFASAVRRGERPLLVVECRTMNAFPPREYIAPRAKSAWPPLEDQ